MRKIWKKLFFTNGFPVRVRRPRSFRDAAIFSAGSPLAYRLKISCTIGAVSGSIWYSLSSLPMVKEIFTRYADGEPAEKIAASLNERGLRTRTGKPFVKNSFFQIFRNRRYIGEYRYRCV